MTNNIRIITSFNENYVEQAIALDKTVFHSEYIISKEKCLNFIKANPEIYLGLVNDDKLIGYINFSPVKETVYRQLLEGNDMDTIISPEDILPYDRKDIDYFAYFSSIVLLPEYRGKGYGKLLMLSLADKICSLAQKGIFFTRIMADAVTKEGEIIATKFGLNEIGKSKHNSKIFELNLSSNNQVTDWNNKIFTIYKSLRGTRDENTI